jgi:amino acid adenylation domain-containing protein
MSATLNQIFEEQEKITPDRVAIMHGNNHITYCALNNRSNQLAHYLRNLGVKIESVISICMERSIDMVVAIIGVLKVGGAYLSIDPIIPEERSYSILNDSGSEILITLSKFGENFLKYKGAIINLDQDWYKIKNNPSTNLIATNTSNNLACIVYTSGTSGKPKGVCILHAAILNRFNWMWEKYPFKTKDIFGQKTSPGFVDFIWESFGPLLRGIKSVIVDKWIINDYGLLFKCIKKHNITHLLLVPSLLEQFMLNNQFEFLLFLKQLTLSGEKTSSKLAWKLKNINTDCIILNLYGSSEVAADATCCNIKQVSWGNNKSIIGNPISNIHVYILDKNMSHVKTMEIGEIYISGIGLARGYLSAPELTAARFLANPFSDTVEKEHSRLYKTGDLAKYLTNGNIEYIGRNDNQVKIRGYRIELEEISQVLSSYKEIEYSVVLAKSFPQNNIYSENKYLVAYYLRKIDSKKIDNESFVNEWNQVYQLEYSSLDKEDFSNNLQLWKSSYTGAYISREEMYEWVNSTVERIMKLVPKVVLEIGSGTGLLLFNIIKDCDHYYAIDFSERANNYVINLADKLGYKDKITSMLSTADNIPYGQINKHYDTVILNSVVQYFPNIDYLSKVISSIISNFTGAGQIFLGDVRDFRLLKCFHYSIQKYKNKNFTKRQVIYFSYRDKELLISPEYFIQLKKLYDKISYVEILPKIGIANNEMNNYRYDVILHINKDLENDIIVVDVKEDSFTKVTDIKQFLETNNKNNLLLIKYPNLRIYQNYQEYLKFNDNLPIKKEYNKILSLTDIQELVQYSGYKSKCFLDPVDPLYLNILLFKSPYSANIGLNYHLIYQSSNISNNPLISSKLIDNSFSRQLNKYLSMRLPEYMIPLYYVPLETLPLTTNGKLDKNALPDLELGTANLCVPPRNELEYKLCEIYADILGLSEEIIGITDEFYKLGGNSLLAIRLLNELNKQLNLNVSLTSLLKKQTIESLSNYISEIKDNEYKILEQGTI